MDKPRVAAIIQARMGSSRMPGKVLLPLAGRPVLWHIIHRLRKCTTLDTIAVATSTSAADDPIVTFARQEGVECVRGSEDNVLERYVLAAKQLKADIIVRITGDAPLIDPPTIDRMVKALSESRADLCSGEPGVKCIHEGIDPFSATALQRVMDEGSDDPAAREHVIAYFRKHPERFTTCTIPIDPEHQFKGARISVDTPADFSFLEQIHARLNVPAGEADLGDVVRLLRAEPALLFINANVHQKDLDEKSRKILIRCDGNKSLGLGHVYRSLALADELRNTHGCGVSFAMATGPVGFGLVRNAYYPFEIKPEDAAEETWMEGIIQRLHPDALVLDVKSGLSRSALEKWRTEGIVCVTIDDGSERRLGTDLAFYPPVPQVGCMDWTEFTGALHTGWEWVLLRREFAHDPVRPHKLEQLKKSKPTLLITMGGSDPAGFTLRAVRILENLENEFEATIVVGAGFTQEDVLDSLLRKTRHTFVVERNVQNMANLMANADIAIASFGVTAYELAAMGVPAVYLCLTDDHNCSASIFIEQGLALNCGVHDKVSDEQIACTIRTLLDDSGLREYMRNKARSVVDGCGVERIATCILKTIKERSDEIL